MQPESKHPSPIRISPPDFPPRTPSLGRKKAAQAALLDA